MPSNPKPSEETPRVRRFREWCEAVIRESAEREGDAPGPAPRANPLVTPNEHASQ